MITFRNIEDKDQAFIEQVYRSTREDELKSTNWPEDQKQRFIIMQLTLQLHDYKKNYPHAAYLIILYKNKPAGRLYISESADKIHLIDISLLPDFRGKSIGTKIITDLIDNATKKNKTFGLYVRQENPAKELYERLGLHIIHSNSPGYDCMEYKLNK